MFSNYKNLRAGAGIAYAALFLLSAQAVQAQGTGCTNTMPGTATGALGCVTFTYKGQTVTYATVRAADGRVWLQQNLGASAVATSKTDTAGYGDFFQWGRWDDGHQSRNSPTGAAPTPNNPSGLGAGSSQFITGTGTAAWWNGGQLTDTWDAATAANTSTTQGADPCKSIGAGWRLPTQAEWAGVVNDEAITNPDQAFGSNLKLTVGGNRSSSSGGFDFVGTRGYYWSSTTSSTGAKYYYFSAAVNNPNAGNLRGGGASVRCLNTTGTVSITDSVDVHTLNNVPATITTNAGTLQMLASVYPASTSQAVTWSIVPGTGAATITTTGLVTAQSNGSIWAKAISVADITKSDSLLVTISNQIVPVTSIDVTTQGNIPATITTNAGTLQMTAAILPATANQGVTWSLVPGTGTASISSTGLVIAQSNGTVWAKAVSVTDNTKSDSMELTISNQVIPIVAIDVTTQGNVPATITTNAGTLQMIATVLPANAVQSVTWSIVPGTGTASISSTGLVTAQSNGTVWAKAISTIDNSKTDSLQIVLSGQGSTGVAAIIKAMGLEVYPNPAQDRLLISISETHPALDIHLSDLSGRYIISRQVAANQLKTPLVIPTAKLATGTYLIQVKGTGINITRKIIKQ